MAEGGEEIKQVGYKSLNYREITPDYIFGGIKPGYLEMIIVTTKRNAFEKIVNQKDIIEHTEEAALKIPPMQVKPLIVWMLQNIKAYEESFGKIPNIEADPDKLKMIKQVDDLIAAL
jgi:hypothetical protein